MCSLDAYGYAPSDQLISLTSEIREIIALFPVSLLAFSDLVAKLLSYFGKFVISYQKDTDYQNNTTMLVCPGSTSKSQHQAVRDTLEVVSGKWKLIILAVLLTRKYRFKELSRELGISPRILSKELQEMETHQLVKRTVCDTRPVTVEYECTPHSQTLLSVVQAMSDWGYLHHETIVGKRRIDAPAVEL